MRVAICYFGLLRTFDKVIDSHQTHIYEIFQRNNIQYDIFIHTWKVTDKSDTSDLSGHTIQNQNLKTIQNIPFKSLQIDDQMLYLKKFEGNEFNLKPYNPFVNEIMTLEFAATKFGIPSNVFEDWVRHNMGKPGMPFIIFQYQQYKYVVEDCGYMNYLRMICGIESQRRSVELALSNEIQYDHFLIIRPDVLIYRDIDISSIQSLNEDTILLLNNKQYGGYNDRAAFCSKHTVRYFSHRVDHILNYREFRFTNVDSYKINSNDIPEYYLKYCLDSLEVKILQEDFLEFDIIRSDGTIYER